MALTFNKAVRHETMDTMVIKHNRTNMAIVTMFFTTGVLKEAGTSRGPEFTLFIFVLLFFIVLFSVVLLCDFYVLRFML